MQLKELHTTEEMMAVFEIIQWLYPEISMEKYQSYVEQMIPHNYTQLAVFEDEICVGLTGYWIGIKLWSGKYLELDNFIVHPEYRLKGIGTAMTHYLEEKAKEEQCTMMVLDAYTQNFKAHRFYYNQGFSPKGFHFVKILDENGLT